MDDVSRIVNENWLARNHPHTPTTDKPPAIIMWFSLYVCMNHSIVLGMGAWLSIKLYIRSLKTNLFPIKYISLVRIFIPVAGGKVHPFWKGHCAACHDKLLYLELLGPSWVGDGE